MKKLFKKKGASNYTSRLILQDKYYKNQEITIAFVKIQLIGDPRIGEQDGESLIEIGSRMDEEKKELKTEFILL